MLLDTQCLFSDEQAITTGAIVSQNVVKFSKSDISFVPLLIQSVSDFSDLTSLKVSVETSADETFQNAVELASSTLLKADLKAGAVFPINAIPKGNLGYIRLKYTVTGTTETTGKITAGVVAGLDRGIQEI